jgi:hypothetical protein
MTFLTLATVAKTFEKHALVYVMENSLSKQVYFAKSNSENYLIDFLSVKASCNKETA